MVAIYRKKVDIILLFIFFVFSCWFMWKSFGYDSTTHEFIIARNVVGDFGLHLSMIRSISWGSNFPVESPFYPGTPMPYHYLFDVIVGIFERIGIRIDVALNGLSAIAFTALLYLIYKFPQRLFRKSFFLGITSVLLFVFHGGLAVVDFFRGKAIAGSLLDEVWHLPNYIHSGPFDGSFFSIFFTPNVYLNQRHTVVGLAAGLWILYALLPGTEKKEKSFRLLLIIGIVLGILNWIHTLIFFGIGLVILLYILLFRKSRYVLPILGPALLFFIPHWLLISMQGGMYHAVFNPGFLSARPFQWGSFIYYWWLNLGLLLLFLPLAVAFARKNQRLFFFCVFPLFIIANTFQLSWRIDHNHTLINIFIIFANFYAAYFLFMLWQKGWGAKFVVLLATVILTSSGILDIMAVKNDFRMRVADAPQNALMQWIKVNTAPSSVFLAPEQILDPVTLSGRRNYLGHSYYLSVMGYPYADRRQLTTRFFEATKPETLRTMHEAGITYVLLPNVPIQDFLYKIDYNFWSQVATTVYRDELVTVYQL